MTHPTNLNRGHTSEKKDYLNYFQEAIWCSHWSYIQKFANTEILWSLLFSGWKKDILDTVKVACANEQRKRYFEKFD